MNDVSNTGDNKPMTTNESSGATATDRSDTAKVPDAPFGSMPPGSRWPVVAFGMVWLAWVGFLFVMMLSRSGAEPG